MVSRSGSSGKAGKGLGLGWATSGGLDGEIGAESTRKRVSGGENCNRCASDSSGEECSVSAESEVPLTGEGRRASGRDRVIRLGAVMAVEGCLLRSCDLTVVTGHAKLCYLFLEETPSMSPRAIGIKGRGT